MRKVNQNINHKKSKPLAVLGASSHLAFLSVLNYLKKSSILKIKYFLYS
jgi:hypothetical protein